MSRLTGICTLLDNESVKCSASLKDCVAGGNFSVMTSNCLVLIAACGDAKNTQHNYKAGQ